MKLLKDYTDEELVLITPEDKNSIYLLELAERGVPLPNSVPEYIKAPSDDERLQPDVTIYCLGGMSFGSSAEAEAVLNVASEHALDVTYDWHTSGRQEYIQGLDRRLEISSKQVYSNDKFQELKEEIAAYEKRKSTVEANNKRRAEIISEQQKVMIEIDDRIGDAQKNVTRLNELRDTFQQYVVMANDDHSVAVRFLLNAHYSEVSEYDDASLGKIGLSRDDVVQYQQASVSATNNEEIL